MSIKISIKDKNLTVKEQKTVEKYGEIKVDYGDWVFIDETKNNIAIEVYNEDLKLTCNTLDVIVLIDFIKLLQANPSENIPKQFNDLNLINQLTTKLEFLKSDLFDDEYLIKDLKSLEKLTETKPEEEKNKNTLQKSITFQYEQKNSIEVANESFEVYEKEDFKIFLRS
ncbi:MAG: hypothetical protein WC141_04525 [Arcobacteraceae bacterium]